MGGHDDDTDDHGAPLLIDIQQRGRRSGLGLLSYTLAQTGPMPVLVEWDNDVPDWPVLQTEANRAAEVLA